jgi:hypothetical protein
VSINVPVYVVSLWTKEKPQIIFYGPLKVTNILKLCFSIESDIFGCKTFGSPHYFAEITMLYTVSVCCYLVVWLKYNPWHDRIRDMLDVNGSPQIDLNGLTIHITDIDECNSDPCLHNGTCIDIINGYSCRCKNDSRGDNCEICK